MTGKLNAWNGRNVTMAGRLTLVKSVLTSQVIQLLSALRVPKEILKLIDNKRKQFLWAGNVELTGGKCKVNLSHPEIIGFQDVIKIKNKTTIFSFSQIFYLQGI